MELRLIGSIIFSIDRNLPYAEVFAPPNSRIIKILLKLNLDDVYTLGLYVGMISPGKWFKPSLPLAHRLAAYCNKPVQCIILSELGERFFLYGKRVVEDNIIEWNNGLSLVVNMRGEALGWGIGAITKIGGRTRRVLEPVWDMGWYLRRGG